MSDTDDAPPRRAPGMTRALLAVGVVAVLVAAGVLGRTLAGPPTAPVVLPVPGCPATLGEAFPSSGPTSTFVVPWGPSNARVCRYPAGDGAGADGARLAGSVVLDPMTTAELAGLLHPLPRAPGACGAQPTRDALRGEVAVVMFGYRPGRTPTVGRLLRVALWTAPATAGGSVPGSPDAGATTLCGVATNGTLGLEVPGEAKVRMTDLVPALNGALPTRR